MKKQLLLLAAAGILSAAQCHKEPVIRFQTDTPDSLKHWLTLDEPITAQPTIRNDIPPPPEEEWRDIDTMQLNKCEQRIWKILKKVYPLPNDNYYQYQLYAFPEPDTNNYIVIGQSYGAHQTFFKEVDCWINCPDKAECPGQIDSTFFLQALGPYTCHSINQPQRRVNYFYRFKSGARRGPCPNIWTINDFSNRCNSEHFTYCEHLLRVTFSLETGYLVSAFFL